MSTKVKYLFEREELKGMDYEKLKEFRIKYLGFLEDNPFPKPQGDEGYYDMIIYLKRKINSDAIKIGPYQNISIFEAANRIASDLVVINGMLQLIEEKGFHTSTFDLCLGTMHTAGKGDVTIYRDNEPELHVEAFNVAPSFLTAKLRATKKKWGDRLDFILINEEAYKLMDLKKSKSKKTAIEEKVPEVFRIKNWEK